MVIREQLDHKKRGDLTSIGRWRKNFTELSIQDLHKFNHYRGGVGPHNSQIHKLENDTIEPYLQVFKSLAGMMDEIAKEKNFTYVPELRIRERLKKAKPYLTHDGRVATYLDFVQIFEGIQPVNPIYLKSEKIPDELRGEFAEALATTFRWVGIENMTNNKETWDQIKKTKSIKRVEEKELLNLAKSVLIGDAVPTEETVRFVLSKYKECPIVCAYRSLVDQPLPKKMEKVHSKLLELVHS
tara:strand:- start:604 stop:1326 length:723 start_codon:yes stop_codon:yes gene_type:complete